MSLILFRSKSREPVEIICRTRMPFSPKSRYMQGFTVSASFFPLPIINHLDWRGLRELHIWHPINYFGAKSRNCCGLFCLSSFSTSYAILGILLTNLSRSTLLGDKTITSWPLPDRFLIAGMVVPSPSGY